MSDRYWRGVSGAQQFTEQEAAAHTRLDYLEKRIAELPCWGALMSVLHEEAQSIRRFLTPGGR